MTITASDMVTDPAAAAGEMPADDEVLTVDQFPSHLGADVTTEDAITTSVEAALRSKLVLAASTLETGRLRELEEAIERLRSGDDVGD